MCAAWQPMTSGFDFPDSPCAKTEDFRGTLISKRRLNQKSKRAAGFATP